MENREGPEVYFLGFLVTLVRYSSLPNCFYALEFWHQFCKTSVEPMGEESDHVHIIALSDTLGVPIRVVYLDRSSCDSGNLAVNHHDFVPSGEDSEMSAEPVVTMLYRPGHYDILYAK